MMETLIYLVVLIAVNQLVACIVLSGIDKHGDLLRWMKAAPHSILEIVAMQLWPIVMIMYFRKENRRSVQCQDDTFLDL